MGTLGDLDGSLALATDTTAVAVDIGGPMSHRAIVARFLGNGNGSDAAHRRLEGDRILDCAPEVCS